MSLPLGHAAIGLATNDIFGISDSSLKWYEKFAFVTILANLPDVDVIIGLFVDGNASAFHRGPTHSVAFALLCGFLASRAYLIWSRIPKLNFGACFLIILSHIFADLLLTSSPVSLLWPFNVYWVGGHRGWQEVVHQIFFDEVMDGWTIMASVTVVGARRIISRYGLRIDIPLSRLLRLQLGRAR